MDDGGMDKMGNFGEKNKSTCKRNRKGAIERAYTL